MALVNQTLKLEITPGGVPPKLHVTEYDENMQVVAQLFQRGQYYEIPSGTTAKVEGTLAGHPFSADATVDGSNVTFELTKGMTAYAGRAWTKIKLTKDSKPVSTCGFWLECDRAGVEAGDVIGAPGFEEQIKDAVEEKISKTDITLGVNEADGLVYIFIGGNPVGNGLEISGGGVIEHVWGQTVIDNTALSIAKGHTVQFGVKLSKQPTQEQVITITSLSDALTLDKTALTFGRENWNVFQFVSVTAGEVSEDTTARIVLHNSDELMTETSITVFIQADSYSVDMTIPEGAHVVTLNDFTSSQASGTDKIILVTYKSEYDNIIVPATMTVDGVKKSVVIRDSTFGGNTTIKYVEIEEGTYFSQYGQAYKQLNTTFSGCTSLIGVRYSGNDVEQMQNAFHGCTSLKFFDGLEKQTNCTSMYMEFNGCSALEYVQDLSGFTNLTDMQQSFKGCSNLKKIYGLPDTFASACNMSMTFYGTALEYVKIPANVNNVFYCCATTTTLKKCEIYEDNLNADARLDTLTFQNCKGLTVYCNDGTTTEETLLSVFGSSSDVEILTFGNDAGLPSIVTWGDSTTSPGTSWGCWPDRLQTKIGTESYLVKNEAVSGEYTTSTSARQGGNSLTVGAFTIPADTTATPITLTSADGQVFSSGPVFSCGGSFNPCTIGGIEGTIAQAGTSPQTYTFTRKVAGDAVEIADGTLVTSVKDAAFNNADNIMIIELGINAGWNNGTSVVPSILLNQVKLMVQHFTEAGGTKYIIFGPYSGQFMRVDSNRALIAQYEEQAASEFGDHFINMRTYLIENGLTENGLTASELDNERMALGQVPASLLGAGTTDAIKMYDGVTVTDDTHPNAYGANSIMLAVYAKGKALGYWG